MDTRGHTITENTASKFTSADMLAPKRYVCLHLHTLGVHGAHTLLLPFFLPFVLTTSYQCMALCLAFIRRFLLLLSRFFLLALAWFGRWEREWEIMVENMQTVQIRDYVCGTWQCNSWQFMPFSAFTSIFSYSLLFPGCQRAFCQVWTAFELKTILYAVIELSEKSKWKMWVKCLSDTHRVDELNVPLVWLSHAH